APRELGDGGRQLLDRLRRRSAPRARRGDRDLDLEAPRLRADGARGAHDPEVRARGRGPAARMSPARQEPAGEPRPRVAIFGGPLSPSRAGRLRAADERCELLGPERVLSVPSAGPPHKGDDAADPLAPAEQRLEWTRLATRDHPRFEVDAIEV